MPAKQTEKSRHIFNNGLNLEYRIPFEEEIEPGENVFEIVTFQGSGSGGLKNALIVGQEE